MDVKDLLKDVEIHEYNYRYKKYKYAMVTVMENGEEKEYKSELKSFKEFSNTDHIQEIENILSRVNGKLERHPSYRYGR